MANAYKVLGQSNPAATTATDVYTVPAATSAVVSTISVANLGTSTTYRIAIRPGGAALSNQHYVAYDVALNAQETQYHTVGFSLATTDVVTVYAGTATVAFSVFGTEIS